MSKYITIIYLIFIHYNIGNGKKQIAFANSFIS